MLLLTIQISIDFVLMGNSRKQKYSGHWSVISFIRYKNEHRNPTFLNFPQPKIVKISTLPY